ncbi:MAG TPA: methyltransferase domain-containing protein [Bryobacteraceae bacterium]|jgi:SAM-dependent methyltransferase|nr:methyltransferase domain-containing protein [Bryobacteraceae bacterium]
MSATAFDNLASQYDRLWTHTTIGHLQREAVWRGIASLFKPGQTVLDLGCGTGEDAVRLIDAGLHVHAIDASSEMVRIARDRGVNAGVLPIEHCGQLEGRFDAVLSNFGALNCVADLESLREPLGRLTRPGGYLVICLIGRFCLWETAWSLLRVRPAKAFRRWCGSAMSSLGFRVFYPSKENLVAALDPHFTLLDWRGIGLAVPPSYVTGLSDAVLQRLDGVDRRVAHWPLLRGLSDHRLLVFIRNS